MFLTCEQNRLPYPPMMGGDGLSMWGVVEMFGGSELLILQFSATSRGIPRVAMVNLSSGAAATLAQLDSDGQVVRGAAVLSAGPQQGSAQWTLEPLREIHLGATEAFDDQHELVSFARFTTAKGAHFSLPIGVADRHSNGKRIFPTGARRAPGARRRKPAASTADTA